MKNSSILSAVNADRHAIPYRKELRQIAGSVTATILLRQFMFWDEKLDGKEFYKFIEPCGHSLYRDGDSWIEETGFSKKEFSTAIKKLEEANLIKKRITPDRVTFYRLNTFLLIDLLNEVYSQEKNQVTKGDLAGDQREFSMLPNGACQVTKGDLAGDQREFSSTNIENTDTTHRTHTNENEKHPFSEFWELYDKKTGRKDCERKWKRISDTDKQLIAEHLPKYIKATPDKQFRKNPLTYLNQEAWHDEIQTFNPIEMNYGANQPETPQERAARYAAEYHAKNGTKDVTPKQEFSWLRLMENQEDKK